MQGHRAEKISLTKHKSREDERKESPLLLATLDVPRAIPNIYVYLLLIYTVLKVGINCHIQFAGAQGSTEDQLFIQSQTNRQWLLVV